MTTNNNSNNTIDIYFEKQKIEGHQKWSYKPIYTGQAEWIKEKCEEEGLFVKFVYGRLRGFAETKVAKFQEIAEESLKVYNPRIGLQHAMQTYHSDHQLIAVGLKCKSLTNYNEDETKEDWLYTFQTEFPMIVAQQYTGAIPIVNHTKIFRVREEMIEWLIANKGVMVK